MADIPTIQLDFNTLHQEVDDVLRYSNIPEATKLSSAIRKSLKDTKLDSAILNDLNHYLVLLNWLKILSISDEVLFKMLKNNIQDSYSIPDFELEEKMADRFSLIDFPEDGAEFLTHVTEALGANTEQLGNQTIGGWVKLYTQSTARNSQKSGFDMVQFLQKNGASLSEDQKVILLEIFKIYDSGKRWLAKYDALPVAQSAADIPDNVVLDMLYGKEDEVEQPTVTVKRPQSIDGLNPQQPGTSQPTPAVKVQTPQKLASAPVQSENPPTTDEIVEKIKREEAQPETVSRLQELLHKKVTPVPLSKPQTESSSVPQQETVPNPQALIDDKLSELKKRINSNE